MSTTLVYTYNAAGLRVGQAVSGTVTTYTWDIALPLAQVLATSDGGRDLHGLDLIAEEREGAWAYALPDALGSVRQWTDASANVNYAASYRPFGEVLEESGSTESAWGFTGEWWDDDAEKLYLRARWYDVGTGRFGRPDAAAPDYETPRTINRYAYVLDNPIGYTDPSGLYFDDVHGEMTREVVEEVIGDYGMGWWENHIVNQIVAGDQRVDWIWGRQHSGLCTLCHFCPPGATSAHVLEAIMSRNPYLFGAALHQQQDLYSHWKEGYEETHWPNSDRAGAIHGAVRTPGGKSSRPSSLIVDFFIWGWSISKYDFEVFPPHNREDVRAELLTRNRGINLDRLNDDDWIDLYLRKDPGRPASWERIDQERYHFGIDPDAYIDDSTRDRHMRMVTRIRVEQFLQFVVSDGCLIVWRRPTGTEILQLLDRSQ